MSIILLREVPSREIECKGPGARACLACLRRTRCQCGRSRVSEQEAGTPERQQAAYSMGPSTLPWDVGFHEEWHGKPLVDSGKSSVRTNMKSKTAVVLKIDFRGAKADIKTHPEEL